MRNNFLSSAVAASAAAAFCFSSVFTPANAAPDNPPSPANIGQEEQHLQLPQSDKAYPWIASHRGQWRIAPENSIKAVTTAINDGAEIVEIDVRRTADGHLVLMHDETVDRTTNGSGKVSELSLAEIKELRLQEGLGNGPAPLTDHQVPTFEEVLEAVEGKNVLLNLDKGWDVREQMYEELAARDMVDYGLFKGAPNVEEANEFMAAHPEAHYMHVVNDAQAGDFEQFTSHMPVAFELVFDNPNDLQAQQEYWDKVDAVSDIWINTMWSSLADGNTDEAALRGSTKGWQAMVDRGADMLQTDNVRTVNAWREGRDVTKLGTKPSSIRVQAEDYIDDPALYHDANPRNECGTRAIRSSSSPVDACDLDGAHIIQYIRDGEWFTLPVTATQPGNYRLSIRHSSDTEPGGTVSVDTGKGFGKPIALPNTTHNRAFQVADLGKFKLDRGTQQIKLKFTHADYASVDWIQLNRGQRADVELMR